MFHIDPITVLGSDDFNWMLRVACAKVVARDHEAQSSKMKQGN